MDFSKKLTSWYLKNKRSFPWRETKDPYKIWLSEIILQQTKTSQGLPYYIKFVNNYPTVYDLANANEIAILKLWQGLGYYSRARNLHGSAQFIVEKLQGEFPKNYKELLVLKGVGDYTASAIASIAFNEKCAVVDGNVYRFLARYFGISTPINSSQGIKEFKLLAQELLPKNNYGVYNQALMDFGAMICTPKKTSCSICILKDSCIALQKKTVDKLPVKTSKVKIKKRYFNYLVIFTKDNKTVLKQRKGKGIWQNLYEFPLIESDTEIEIEDLIRSSIFIDLFPKNKNVNVRLFNLKEIVHKLSHQHLYTKFWIVKTNQKLEEPIPFKNIQKYPVPTLINNFIKVFKY